MKNIRYILSALLGICLILSGCQNLTEPAGSTLPTVETGDALEITSHSATITGKYNPEHRRIYFLFPLPQIYLTPSTYTSPEVVRQAAP